MTKITLPGSIPGGPILRLCSPVINTVSTLVPYGKRGVVVSKVEPDRGIEVAFDNDESIIAAQSCFALDLEDPTGRAHAIWWLARQTEIHFNSFNQISFCVTAIFANRWGLRVDDHRDWEDGDDLVVWSPEDSSDDHHTKIDTLKNLNCNDKTLLADGSRWVDAEALRRICLQHAGLE